MTQMPHPMHKSSEMYASFDEPDTSMHSLPTFTTGHDFLHSCLHFFGLHRSADTMAMRSSWSLASSGAFFPFLPISRVSFRLFPTQRPTNDDARAVRYHLRRCPVNRERVGNVRYEGFFFWRLTTTANLIANRASRWRS